MFGFLGTLLNLLFVLGVEVREAGEIFSVDELRRKAGLSKTIIEMLRSYGVFEGMQENDQFSFF